jgi:hypothetical protein
LGHQRIRLRARLRRDSSGCRRREGQKTAVTAERRTANAECRTLGLSGFEQAGTGRAGHVGSALYIIYRERAGERRERGEQRRSSRLRDYRDHGTTGQKTGIRRAKANAEPRKTGCAVHGKRRLAWERLRRYAAEPRTSCLRFEVTKIVSRSVQR